ncbi:MAG: hypothetical protein K0S33_3258 [Bacteroidetes bacterium]|nr:hypothetical protein [Bacteroidota bacterium]
MGKGIAVSNFRYTGFRKSIGIFSADKAIIGLDSGLILSTGNAEKINGPNEQKNFTSRAGTNPDVQHSDKDLRKAAKAPLFDMALLEFDFIPVNNQLSFNYVFASEEYPEYVGSQFNDVFGFYIKEKGDTAYRNIAVVPGTNAPISVNTVNASRNAVYFCNNNKGEVTAKSPMRLGLEFDGLTKVITAMCDVIPYKVYHMKIAIADASDMDYDSGVFIQAGTFSSTEDPAGKYYEVLKEIKKKKIRFNPDSIFQLPAKVPGVKTKKEPFKQTNTPKGKPLRITVYFDTNKSDLKPKEKTKLDSIMKLLAINGISEVELSGFTDSTGNISRNQKLAQKRDESVKAWLLEKGIGPGMIKQNESQFLKEADTNKTENGRANNRRVELIFYRRTK